MGVTLAALEERGLVRRSRDPGDGRRIVVSITEDGQRRVHDKRGAAKAERPQARLQAVLVVNLGKLGDMFGVSAGLSVLAGLASLLRGKRQPQD